MMKKENQKFAPQKKKCMMNTVRIIAVCFVILFLPQVLSAQTAKRTIAGQVFDEDGALQGASVQVKGTAIGVGVGPDGKFTIDVPTEKKSPILVISFVGYETQERVLGKQDYIKISMHKSASNLKGATVVAYGKRDKRELVTAVSSINAKDIADMPSASIDNLLQGKMAGVQIINQAGAPGGGGTSVNIRGFNSLFSKKLKADGSSQMINDGQPLYVIDGVPVDASTGESVSSHVGDKGTGISGLAEIDPSTIESVTVLKDAASAALYGSRAANGVILITTKQGVAGKAKITANVTYGRSILPTTNLQTIGKAERDWQLLMMRHGSVPYYHAGSFVTPTSYNATYNTSGAYDGFFGNGVRNNTISPMVTDSLNKFYNNSTNWWKLMFKPSSTVTANVVVQGGSELVKYMVAAGVFTQKGIMPNSNFRRGNFTSNLNFTPRKGLTLSTRTYLAYTDKSMGAGSVNGVQSMTFPANSTSSLIPGSGDLYDNIQKRTNETISKASAYRLTQTLKGSLDIYKGLNFTTSFSVDYSQNNANTFYAAGLAPGNNYGLNETIGSVGSKTTISNENMLRYNFKYKEDHSFKFLLGQTYLSQTNSSLAGNAYGIGSDQIHYAANGTSNTTIDPRTGEVVGIQTFASNYDKAVMTSYLGQVIYNYKRKYMFESSLRRDGSSVFGSANRWATFPSVAAGWSFTEEPFMKDLYWLSDGKFRASWGETGSQFADPYLGLGILKPDAGTFMGQTGLTPTSLLNTHLGWEQSSQYDFGLDMSFLNYRLQFKLDYYYKLQSQQLYLVRLPGDVYYQSKEWLNAMKTSNQGMDLELNYDVMRGGKFTWKTTLVANRNWNKFLNSYNGMDIDHFVLGAPSSRLTVYLTDGIIQKASDIPTTFLPDGTSKPLSDGAYNPYTVGMRKIRDVNGDGIINIKDMVYMGSTFPIADGGWTNTFHYGDFDASFLVTFTVGRDIINYMKYNSLNQSPGGVAPLLFDNNQINYWTADNTNAQFSTPGNTIAYSTLYTPLIDTNIEHVSYARMKKITLGYSVPKAFVQKAKLEGLRFYGTVENLFLISNYSGADPETVPIQTGLDMGDNYPLARTFTLGMTVNF